MKPITQQTHIIHTHSHLENPPPSKLISPIPIIAYNTHCPANPYHPHPQPPNKPISLIDPHPQPLELNLYTITMPPKNQRKTETNQQNFNTPTKIIIHFHPKHNPPIYYSTTAPPSPKIMRQRELESQGVKGRKLGERKEKRKLEGERERAERKREADCDLHDRQGFVAKGAV